MGLGPWPPWTEEGGSKNASWWSDAWTPKRASRVLIVNKSCQPGQKRDVNPVKTQGGNPVNSVNPVNPVCRRAAYNRNKRRERTREPFIRGWRGVVNGAQRPLEFVTNPQ